MIKFLTDEDMDRIEAHDEHIVAEVRRLYAALGQGATIE